MVYRDAEAALRQRRDELLALRRAQIEAFPARAIDVVARRQARRYGGATGVLVAVVLAGGAATGATGLTHVLEAAWPLMLGVYLFARVAAGANLRERLHRQLVTTDDVAADVDRLSRFVPAEVVAVEVERAEWRSVAMPMTALALLLPLSLHFLAVVTLRLGPPRLRDFDGWIRLSLLFVGHCHLVLCYHVWRFARSLPQVADGAVVDAAERAGWRAWGVTILSSLVAGILLVLIVPLAGLALVISAPVLVAATGLAFVPAMFNAMGRLVRRERAAVTEVLRASEYPELYARMELPA